MLLTRLRAAPALRSLHGHRLVSTLSKNPFIKVFPNATLDNRHILTYLDAQPPSTDLAIGTSTENPPTPQSFSENHKFLKILYDVLAEHAAQDPLLQSQAQAFAGPGGMTFGAGGGVFHQQTSKRSSRGKHAADSGAGGASAQGGAGGGGVGGYVHLSDLRNPPDFGRIAWPEDIMGSIEVDGHGQIVGKFEPSGTYRIVTNEGILGLSDFLRNKLIDRLREEERKI
ncbi:hypothetical protein PFICI_13399 [Pestalotiopsis fici W106-1]|uniref:Uncharacterized protein n=1 Tax=Pestalotiopsis fici (strain W106-1 / CGMCC3.15140) TaxID=1229662 RepID=W3WLW3_PESFW|nr:uncharacterized protein PFICI_13399 [Pestalotiopsis fici W106-1]ETS74915.1 hypothetical protein PFICI_13399 [Pestalotiopsis fici W106-1]